ncbi:DUF7666 domain-containing protein [Ruminiclostridium cellulolyticum]|uniref:DUF7666 domain-containing protein n=1 Tax=Ruminiclostridium cellulolyticum (strain ATCC 35319 / DSM 5812 / JCM 6584 / H10) TaxID=394503 RepID=B8I928_RUMCH|nr:hypothetical protein [Ruminiclostridium cellulolyticum]ACL77360.1 hypothetical protein Ccel_3068 [Ruminiclostridium cellulolyticum H10]
MKGFKGFDKNLICDPTGSSPFQYEIGKDYEHDGEVEACSTGFHFCENPMDVLGYYPPNDSRYCEVEGDGEIDKESDGDSKVAASKIHISAEIGLKGIIEAGVKFILDKVNWKDAKVTNTGDQSVACALGIESKARGALGCWLVIAEWEYNRNDYEWHRKDVKCALVDGEIIKDDTWYTLKDGNFVEVTEEK